MEKAKYDIFISYRRSAYDTANLIAEKLRHSGYRVFFDIDTLTSGKFNEQLLEVIHGCKDFILILPENALDRCADPNDWIRREVMCAIEHKKNIIPVMLDGFSWPSEMPAGMEELPYYQAIAAVNRELFDMAVNRLKGYLKSKPAIPIKNWLIKAAVVLAVLIVFLGVGYGVAKHIANVTCEHIATQQSSVMGAVDAIGDFRRDLLEYSDSFFKAMDKCKDEAEERDLESELLRSINKIEKDVKQYKITFPAPNFDLTNIESYILANYDINQDELNAFPVFYLSLYDDIEGTIETLKEMIASHDYSRAYRESVSLDLTCMTYAINSFYYGYLGCLSLLPKSARKVHYELAKKWRNFPNGTPLDLSQEEYEQFQAYEVNRYEEEVSKYGNQVNYEERRLNELENQVEQLQNAIEQ